MTLQVKKNHDVFIYFCKIVFFREIETLPVVDLDVLQYNMTQVIEDA